ncbi:MAG: polysaccharide deacetylase family protein [Pirellulales bacterium]
MRRTIRKIAVPLAAKALELSGWSAKIVRQPGTHLLYLHHVSDLQWFDDWMKSISKRFELIDHNQALERIETGRHPCSAVSISFDDGFASCWSAAEILEKYKTRGLFYICPNVVGAKQKATDKFFGFAQPEAMMDWQQIKKLSDRGHLFGGHTCTHPNLAEVSERVAEDELKRSKNVIEEKLGVSCDHFAWPYGRRQAITEQVIQKAYTLGFKSVASGIRGSHSVRHRGVLLRNVVGDGEPVAETLMLLAMSIKQLDSYGESRAWVLSQNSPSADKSTAIGAS